MPDGYPQNVVAVTSTSTAILVEWEPVPASQRNGYITHYEIELNQTTFPQLNTSELRQTTGAQLMLLLTDLEEFVEYTMRVRAYTSVGAGPFSPNVSNATFTDRKRHIASLMCTLIMCCVPLFQDLQHHLRLYQSLQYPPLRLMYHGRKSLKLIRMERLLCMKFVLILS